jgi:4-amino-4-deoxy-L-arabinose transferase-like glycosyltransferase
MFSPPPDSAKKPGMAASPSHAGNGWLNKIRRWFALHPKGTLTLIVLAALGPFLAKPFNIDDPLFLWTARQIHAHPLNPYGFNVEWGWTEFPMWKVTENPPLAGYYLALAAGIFGWSEVALHSACLLPALAVILGTHRLARHFCNQPRLAAIATLFMPVFLVSAGTVMCDVPMLALWVWAVVLWIEGTEQDKLWRLGISGALIALAAMTKYYGACLLPLLAAYSLLSKRRVGRWAQFLLIPLAILCAYQWVTQARYGYSLLYRAMDYASFSKSYFGFSHAAAGLTALTFTGGCLAAAIFLAPALWRKRTLAAFAGGAVLVVAGLLLNEAFLKKYAAWQGTSRMLAAFQIGFWAAGGASVLALAGADVFRRRDAQSWLLALWVLGTFGFAAFCNWTINGRSLLPLAPAVGILLARRLVQNASVGCKIRPPAVAICFALSAALALFVARADFLLAIAVRQSAQQVCQKNRFGERTLWFQGHWGFQYYMEKLGALPLDVKRSRLKPGDGLAVPANNTNLLPPDPKKTALLATVVVPGPCWLATLSAPAGAGFYASVEGPLPFAFGRVPPEIVSVYVLGVAAPPAQKN